MSDDANTAPFALAGVKVLDLSRVLAGPWSTQILADLGITEMKLMTNNPAKYGGLDGYGLTIAGRMPLHVDANPENIRYLETKRERMGHITPGEDSA